MAQQLLMNARRSVFLMNNFRSTIVRSRNFCAPSQKGSESAINRGTHKVNDFERKLLVWSGKYKNKEEIPGYVSQDVVERARNKFRIRVANIMILLTFIGCGIMIMNGRKAVERGESVLKMNQEWHKEYNDKAQEEALAKVQTK